MRKTAEKYLILVFTLLTIIVFREYFFENKVPFPSNLLVSFYEPWVSYEWEGYPNGPPNKPAGFDNLRIFYPLKKITIDQLKNFDVPLWNPYSFSGNTHLATYQSAVFHPLGFLFLVLPQIDAWSIIIILQPFLCLIFTYLYLREIGCKKNTSFFGAVVFAFSSYMIVWWEESYMSVYSTLFLPLILFSLEKLIKRINSLAFTLLVIGLTFSLLSGWFQSTLYVWSFSFIYALFHFISPKQKMARFIFFVISAYIVSLLLSSIHLIPSLEAYFYSARGSTDAKFIFDSYFLTMPDLVKFIAPDFWGNPGAYNYMGQGFYYEKSFYFGISALIFVLYELFSFKNIKKKENFFKLSFIVTFSLAFSLPTSWLLLYHLKLPLISTVLPSRILLLSVFCASVLSVYGLEKFLLETNRKKMILILSFIAAVFTILGILSFYYKAISYPTPYYSSVPMRNLILPLIIFFTNVSLIIFFLKFKEINLARYFSTIYFLKIIYRSFYSPFKFKDRLFHIQIKTLFVISVILISLFNSFYQSNKYLYFSDRKLIYPEVSVLLTLSKNSGINRFWSLGKGYVDRNLAAYYNLFSPEGYDSIYIKRYGELMYAAQNKGRYYNQIPRTDAAFSNFNSLDEFIVDPYREKLFSLLSVKYIIVKNDQKGKTIDGRFQEVWNDNSFTIFHYKNALPRMFLVDNYVISKQPSEILANLFNNNLDLSKTLILEEEPSMLLRENLPLKGIINLEYYKANEILFKTNSNKDSLLFLSDNYFPGWKAYIDGKETKLYRANYSFRSVVLPKGKHSVIFKYEPKTFFIGAGVTVFGIVIFAIIIIYIRRKKYGKN
ncbi:hypothetical protein C4577_06060 [Candidatus Parcubacteria bacterium]|nr:MAG: hypothetical protein C4577_06060 [Candidatus Parcubacteria bacterium]